ncbi:hypothetical protein HQ535_14395 [bacterium]|nr:hypothetical protein [bacterium]
MILHRTGNGSVQVYRDVTGPTVGLTIDAGAAITTDRPVSLAITASDPQTGIRRMRFSTDGTFDFEPWQAPSGSGTVTLPVGDGIKQVWVQAENQAGIRTNTSDTIRLYTGPRCAGNLPTQFDSTEGDDVINGTSARDVIHGRGGDDVINGLSGHDILCGGDGNDVIRGANGNDRMWGDAGADLLIGHRGNDKMYGGGGNDRLQGRLGNDRMDGGLGKDDRCNGSLGPADVAIACERISGVP